MKRPGNALGSMLRMQRLSRLLTQEQAGALIGTTGKQVSRWELGRREPSMAYLRRIAKVYSMQLSMLADMKGEPEDGGKGKTE